MMWASFKFLTACIPGGSLRLGFRHRLVVAPRPATAALVLALTAASLLADTPNSVTIASFVASPPTVRLGEVVTLSWATAGATSVEIDHGVGSQPPSGSTTLSLFFAGQLRRTATYTLTAFGSGGLKSTAQATVTVLDAPLVVARFPEPMVQAAGKGGATTTFTLTNIGGLPTTITLSQMVPPIVPFFNQSPSSFFLPPGTTQTVTVTALAQPAGFYFGAVIPSGEGVPQTSFPGAPPSSGLPIPILLLSVNPPNGNVTADPSSNRVDTAGAADDLVTGSVNFTNRGNVGVTGIFGSDVPWIIPPQGPVQFEAGATVPVTFAIDRSQRLDSASLIGSTVGTLSFFFLPGGSQTLLKRSLDAPSPPPSVSLVKIVDTVKTAVTVGDIPMLAPGEVGLFVPGVGHTGGVGGSLFVSDLSLLNRYQSQDVHDLKLYYTSLKATASASKATLLPVIVERASVSLADVVKNVFDGKDEVGTLQIRSKDADKLTLVATVLTTSDPAGTFGNTIPVFRSDRSAAANGVVVLTGLRKDAGTHTNLYVQETAGEATSFEIEFVDANGTTVASRSESIDGFRLRQLLDAVPLRAVAAFIRNSGSAGGKVVAYATPVDELSSDTWAIADWSQQLGYAPTEPAVIPAAGSLRGRNDTFYRTDFAITNRSSTQASGTLRYISRSGEKIDRGIELGGRQSEVIADVIGGRFGVNTDTVGYLMYLPRVGSVAISSRTYTTIGAKPGSFGAGIPALAAASALRIGESRLIAGLSDASRATVTAGRPATFRTNFAIMETSGESVTVRVTFRFSFPVGMKAQGLASASRDYSLEGNQFLMLHSMAGEVMGASRLQFGDLSNGEAGFQIISGRGAVLLFTSSVDNGTGDSVVRIE